MTKFNNSSSPRSRLSPLIYLAISLLILLGSCGSNNSELANRISLGDRLLIKTSGTQAKSDGIKAFTERDYDLAIENFQASLKDQPNDPEARIYLNNSSAAQFTKRINLLKPPKIAVVVPIGSNLNIAQEILRGVAQIQQDINRQDGVKNALITVEIYDDDNKPEIAKQIADKVIGDPQVLAVIGSNTSNASLAAAPVYQQAGVVMMTPTSMSRDLSGIGSFIFRTVSSSQVAANLLAHQIIQVDRKHKLAICFDSSAADNVSFRDDLMTGFAHLGGEIVGVSCDVAAANFDPASILDKAINSGADALFFSSHIDRLPKAFQIAQANHGRLPMYSSPTLNTFQTLEEGYTVDGLTIVTPWQPPLTPAKDSFADLAKQLWGGQVSWRTAMSFDAGSAILTGLQQSDGTRQGLQRILHQPGFSANGATGTVKFLPTGDREIQPTIIQVQQRGDKWVFGTPRSQTIPQPQISPQPSASPDSTVN
jgi:branched-chain amino acid transport system substrate-binding protein